MTRMTRLPVGQNSCREEAESYLPAGGPWAMGRTLPITARPRSTLTRIVPSGELTSQ